jgi:hypothetical protein
MRNGSRFAWSEKNFLAKPAHPICSYWLTQFADLHGTFLKSGQWLPASYKKIIPRMGTASTNRDRSTAIDVSKNFWKLQKKTLLLLSG